VLRRLVERRPPHRLGAVAALQHLRARGRAPGRPAGAAGAGAGAARTPPAAGRPAAHRRRDRRPGATTGARGARAGRLSWWRRTSR
jgi:hypothetical protein